MEFYTHQSLVQKQSLSTSQIQSLKLLACTNQELEAFLIKEYLENPMLENSVNKENEMLTDVEAIYEKGKSYGERYLEDPEGLDHRSSDVADRPKSEFRNHLLHQLPQGVYSRRQLACMEYLIGCLDDDGFFTIKLQELSKTGESNPCNFNIEELEEALTHLKTLEPTGIFSQNLSECLIIQLKKKGIEDEILFCLIEDHLEELMKGKFSSISRSLKITTAQIKGYLHEISLLNPRPLMNIETEEATYILPDIIVTRSGDSWDITLNDSWMGEYSINGYYVKMMQETKDLALKQYFKEKLERTRLIINSIEQRRQTLTRIAAFLLDYQYTYFEEGGALKPLKQEQVADALHIHISTVSRAIQGKYLQYKKTLLLKSLFTAAISSSPDQEDTSAQTVKNRILKLIEQEEKALSDQKLADLLNSEGIQISRRGVTKYRIELGIPDSRQRKLLK